MLTAFLTRGYFSTFLLFLSDETTRRLDGEEGGTRRWGRGGRGRCVLTIFPTRGYFSTFLLFYSISDETTRRLRLDGEEGLILLLPAT